MRFRDNEVHPTSSPELSATAADLARQNLAIYGVQLKDGEPGHGLFDMTKGGSIPVLGFQVSLETTEDGEHRTRFDLPDGWQQELGENIAECYACCDPVYAVKSLIRSWISWAGPALRNTAELFQTLDTLLSECGFVEVRSRQFRSDVERSVSRWQSFYSSRASLWKSGDV